MIGKELKFLLKHSSIYGIGTVVNQAVGFLLLPLYTRYLTLADYGVLSLINITIDIIGLIVTIGIVNAMSRFYFDFDEERKQNLVVSTVYWIFFIMTLVFLPLLYFLSVPLSKIIFQSAGYQKHFLVAFLGLFFGACVDIGVSYLRIKAESVKYVKISVTRTLMLIGFNIYFVAVLKSGVIGIFYSTLITTLVYSLILSVPILIKVKIRFSFTLAKQMIHYSFPLIFSNMFRIMVNQSDKYFINFFFSTAETGIYSVAQKIGQSIHSLITSPFLQTFVPRRFEIMKRPDAKETYAQILNYYLLVIGTVGLGLSVFSFEIVKIMTTPEYYQTAQYVSLVVLSMIIFGLKYHFEIGIMIHKKTKYVAYINGVSAVANIVLNFFLIQEYRLWGALLAANISILITTSLNYIISQKLYHINFRLTYVHKLMALISFIYLASLLLNFSNLWLSFTAKGGLFLIYFAALWLLGLVDKTLLKTAYGKIQALMSKSG